VLGFAVVSGPVVLDERPSGDRVARVCQCQALLCWQLLEWTELRIACRRQGNKARWEMETRGGKRIGGEQMIFIQPRPRGFDGAAGAWSMQTEGRMGWVRACWVGTASETAGLSG
jgi:hypothetical protein